LLRDGFERVASDRLIDWRKRDHYIFTLTRERWLPKASQDDSVLRWLLVADGEVVQQRNRAEVAIGAQSRERVMRLGRYLFLTCPLPAESRQQRRARPPA
jgi:hypothetical protein